MSWAKLQAYRALLRQQMIAGLQYRANFWGQIITNIFWGYVRAVTIWVFYRWGAGEAGISAVQAVAMVWLQQTAGNLLPGWGMDLTVWNKIVSGDVGYELVRPLDLYSHWYTNALAVKLAPFLLSFAPIVAVAMLVPAPLGLTPPVSLAHVLACLIALMTGLLLSCATICLSYAMAMDLRVGPAPANLFMYIVQILAGGHLPLQLWPDWMQTLLYAQPFAGIMDLPLRFYVGTAELTELARVVPLLLTWALAIGYLARTWINRNLRKLVVQGG